MAQVGNIFNTLLLLALRLRLPLWDQISSSPNDIRFYLYPDSSDPAYREEIDVIGSMKLHETRFKPHAYTVFIIHGLYSPGDPDLMQPIKDAYLASGMEANIIQVHWYPLSTVPATPMGTTAGYVKVASNVPIVAKRVADLLDHLVYADLISLEDVHIVGFSLGAHIAGQSGQLLQESFGGKKIGRITGLDPAGPLFYPPTTERNLDRTDADFVDVIHTSGGTLGCFTADGHVDFYVNGGMFQPNCSDFSTFPPGRCSHFYSNYLYAATIKNEFMGCQTQPLEIWTNALGFTSRTKRGIECRSPQRMGQFCSKKARGRFYIEASNPISLEHEQISSLDNVGGYR